MVVKGYAICLKMVGKLGLCTLGLRIVNIMWPKSCLFTIRLNIFCVKKLGVEMSLDVPSKLEKEEKERKKKVDGGEHLLLIVTTNAKNC